MENPVSKLHLRELDSTSSSSSDSVGLNEASLEKIDDKADWGINTNWKNINLESAKFFFSQAEIMLQGLLTDYYLTTKRAYWFLTIVTSISSFGLKSIYDYFIVDSSKEWSLYIGLIIVAFTTIIYVILFSLIFPKSIRAIGSPPSKLVNEGFYKKKDDEFQTLGIYISEITDYEERIQIYISANKSRGDKIRKVLILLVVLAIFTLLIYLVGLG